LQKYNATTTTGILVITAIIWRWIEKTSHNSKSHQHHLWCIFTNLW